MCEHTCQLHLNVRHIGRWNLRHRGIMASTIKCWRCKKNNIINSLWNLLCLNAIIFSVKCEVIHSRSMITVYPKKYAHGFVVLCFDVVMQSFIMNSHEVFIHIHQGCFAGTGAIVRLPQCQWSKPDGYGKIIQCITTTKRSKAKTVCIFLGIYCLSTNTQPINYA